MGINNLIQKTQTTIIDVVNEGLQNGVPILCMSFIINDINNAVRAKANVIIEQEKNEENVKAVEE